VSPDADAWKAYEPVAAVVLALCSSLCFGVADFLGGLAARRLAVVVVLLVSQTAGLAGIAAIVAVRADGPPDSVFIPLALVSSALGLVGLAALYRGLAVGLMSVVAPIASTAAVIPVLKGAATGEAPTALQNAGIGLALGGVVLVSLAHGDEAAQGRVAAGAGLGLVAAACFGCFLVAFDQAAENDPYWAVLVLRLGSCGLVAMAWLVLRPRPSLALGGATVLFLVAIGVLDVAGNALFAVASTKGLVGIVSVLSSLYPVATVALARIELGERLRVPQAAGVACAFAGVALIAAG
jgi:drug/metabolite transporter (DMT)-like permease